MDPAQISKFERGIKGMHLRTLLRSRLLFHDAA
jgi:hypothetical protein